jgi:hypothetical protein
MSEEIFKSKGVICPILQPGDRKTNLLLTASSMQICMAAQHRSTAVLYYNICTTVQL